MTKTKTSISYPLRIDSVVAPGGGLIGMTLCPGKKQNGALSGDWDRDLGLDLDTVRDWGAVAVVTLMEANELERYQVSDIGNSVSQRHMTWHHLRIIDANVPDERFEQAWTAVGPELCANLADGRNVLLHCLGGLGRTGTIAARLMIELGIPTEQAIVLIRKARPGAIETAAQEAYARCVLPIGASIPT